MRMPGHTAELSSRVVVPADLSVGERTLWRRLQQTEPALRSAFFSLAYVEAVAAVQRGVRVCVLQRGGEPVGFFPFQFTTPLDRWLRSAERVGGEMTDYCGLIAAAGLRISPRELLRLAHINYFLFSHLDEAQLDFGLTGERPESGLLIRFPEGGNAYWQELRRRDKTFVADTERRERKLEREFGPLRFHFDDPNAEEVIEVLIERKRARYADTAVADALAADWKRALLANLCRSRAAGCTGVLSSLYCGDRWVALHFGLRADDQLHYWFPVFNADFSAFAPGRLLLKNLIFSGAQHGLACIDRGEGESVAKLDFANARHAYLRGAWRRPGLRSLLSRGTYALDWRLGGAVRRLLTGERTYRGKLNFR